MPAGQQRAADICAELHRIAEAIDELAMDLLRDAVNDGATARPALDKPLGSARRSVLKAISTLERAIEPVADD